MIIQAGQLSTASDFGRVASAPLLDSVRADSPLVPGSPVFDEAVDFSGLVQAPLLFFSFSRERETFTEKKNNEMSEKNHH